jgi:predicted lipoprotein with Yx(FWY)xxD motif
MAIIGAAALALAACGGPSGGGEGGYGAHSDTHSPVSSATAGGSATVGTTEIASIGAVLADSKGFTLYHLTTERDDGIQCVRACARMWPPLLAPGGDVPAASGLPGHLATVERPDGGEQVTYDGLPLYRYSGDIAPKQANGQGVQDVWFAVGPGGASEATGISGGDSGGGGYGGGGYGGGDSGGGGYGGRENG